MINNKLYKQFFYHIYYSIYLINKRASKSRSAISASILISLIGTLDLIFVINVLKILTINLGIILSIFISLFSMHIIFFFRKRYYIELEGLFKHDHVRNKILSILFLFIMLIFAICLSIIDLKLSK